MPESASLAPAWVAGDPAAARWIPPGPARRRAIEFFTTQLRNPNTRRSYRTALESLARWSGGQGLQFDELAPVHIAAYLEDSGRRHAAPTVKQRLAAIRMFYDWLVLGQCVAQNPAAAVRGPKHVVRQGKTPVLTAAEARQLLESIPGDTLDGIRDRAIVAVLLFSCARVGAVTRMAAGDFFRQDGRWWFRLGEKGGKYHEAPAHSRAVELLRSWIEQAEIDSGPLFRTFRRARGALQVTERAPHPNDIRRMLQRRARAAGLETAVTCHTFRATGITIFLENGGTLERAQALAGHESPRTTQLYDRTRQRLAAQEIEKIVI